MADKYFFLQNRTHGEILSLKRLNTEKVKKSCIVSKVLSGVWFYYLKFTGKYQGGAKKGYTF